MTITLEDVVEATKAVVVEKGADYKYEYPRFKAKYGDGTTEMVEVGGCVYSDTETNPSCIVGYVVHQLTPELFKTLHNKEWNAAKTVAISVTVRGLSPTFKEAGFTQGAINFLGIVQDVQDYGGTWGEALHEGMSYAKPEGVLV